MYRWDPLLVLFWRKNSYYEEDENSGSILKKRHFAFQVHCLSLCRCCSPNSFDGREVTFGYWYILSFARSMIFLHVSIRETYWRVEEANIPEHECFQEIRFSAFHLVHTTILHDADGLWFRYLECLYAIKINICHIWSNQNYFWCQ